MLREAFKNLIDNALRHGARPAYIDVRLERDGARGARHRVRPGTGHPAGLAHAAFERFVRGPNPRSAGAGLGLSIVRRAVDSHHGELRLSNRVGGRGWTPSSCCRRCPMKADTLLRRLARALILPLLPR